MRPLGLAPLQAGPVLWALFPLLCITGFVLLAMVGKEAKVHAVTFIVSCLLLLLALAAITGIVKPHLDRDAAGGHADTVVRAGGGGADGYRRHRQREAKTRQPRGVSVKASRQSAGLIAFGPARRHLRAGRWQQRRRR